MICRPPFVQHIIQCSPSRLTGTILLGQRANPIAVLVCGFKYTPTRVTNIYQSASSLRD